jgi:EmrB/QacA subfamily drug resistance transporter
MEYLSNKQKFTVLGGIMLGLLLGALDSTIVGTAMPVIVRKLGGMTHYAWVATVYMLFATTSIPIFGKLADMYGRKKFYLLGIIIFLAGSALCGISASMTQLIIFRAFQGIGGGVMMSNSFALIGDIFPPAERGKYQGFMGAAFGLASVIGPATGGFITDNLNWRWVFYVNIPLGILAILFIIFYLPDRTSNSETKSIDYLGVAFLILLTFPMLIAFSLAGRAFPWGSTPILGLLGMSAVMLLVFLFIESRAENPVIPLSLFKNSIFVVSVTARFLSNAGMFGAIMFIPLFVQRVVGASATDSGMITTPMMLSMVIASIACGQIISRTGKYKIPAIVGFVIMSIGMYMSTRLNINTTNAETIRDMLVMGVGLGITMPIFVMVVQNAFPHKQLGVVTSSVQFFGNMGSTIGNAIMGSIMNNSFSGDMVSNVNAMAPGIKKLIPPGALDTLLSGNIQKINELILEAEKTAGANPISSTIVKHVEPGMKHALANSIAHIFVFGIIITLMALAICFFLKEIPLRKTHRHISEEAGAIVFSED